MVSGMHCNAQDRIVIWRCHQTAAQDHFGTGAVHIALVHTRMPGHQLTSLLTPCAGTWSISGSPSGNLLSRHKEASVSQLAQLPLMLASGPCLMMMHSAMILQQHLNPACWDNAFRSAKLEDVPWQVASTDSSAAAESLRQAVGPGS